MTLFLHGNEASCGNPVGWLTVDVSGGAPPYTYLWSTGSTNDTITGLLAGNYSVTVTDALLEEVSQAIDVMDLPYLMIPAVWSFNGSGAPACPGLCDGRAIIYTQSFNGLGPYTITFDQFNQQVDTEPLYGDPVFGGFCSGTNSGNYTVVDQYGCAGTGNGFDIFGAVGGQVQLGTINAACGGEANGSVTFNNVFDLGLGIFGTSVTVFDDQENVVAGPSSGSPLTFSGLATGNHTARVYWFDGNEELPCFEEHPFTVPDPGPDCGSVQGRIYLDHDQDCTQDANDEAIPYHVLEVLPGPVYALTSGDGTYAIGLASGNYTLSQTPQDIVPICPAVDPVPLNITNGALVTQDFADSSAIPLDVITYAAMATPRPGFLVNNQFTASNSSGQLTGAVEVSLTIDPVLSFVSAVPVPTSVVGNTVLWSNMPALGAFGVQHINLVLQVPPDPVLIGTVVYNTWSVAQPFVETSSANNTFTTIRTITGSFDPNEKSVLTSSRQSGTQYFIDQDDWLDYTIQFQNTGTDTAFTVVVTDTLTAELDMASFQQGTASHLFSVMFKPGRLVEWRFDTILLPDSVTNEAESHGLVSFRIRPAQPVLPGTIMSNTANIYFDFNPPVITEPSVLVAEFSTAVNTAFIMDELNVFPNPTNGSVTVKYGKGSIRSFALLATDGRTVLTERLGGSAMAEIDLATIATGTYVVVITTGTGEQLHTRLTKL
ncbi:MAG: T9SS type A sorting domain-containing protein [Flavobacteriales bacterium]|nr:T9SS type A sorting domain-containing protein [Flavobacteriales bacterium]